MLRSRMLPEHLAIQHVRQPCQRMPIAGVARGERPDHVVPFQDAGARSRGLGSGEDFISELRELCAAANAGTMSFCSDWRTGAGSAARIKAGWSSAGGIRSLENS